MTRKGMTMDETTHIDQKWRLLLLLLSLFVMLLFAADALAQSTAEPMRKDSYVQNERDIAIEQPGPHEGLGKTTAYPFFEQAEGFDLIFRKRALHPGATIGAHTNDKDEIYYILSGKGELTLQGKTREVSPGDAILTRKGDSHALKQLGSEDLLIFIVYRKQAAKP
ncbi:cupin domain-containing protein [Luteimonas panaciterrae]|uniref:cupin domain-containing protein n=1 Tax=Luteimonas panaciterrae TaxID=363885 RepID=UPI001CFAC123|nr:cupin domain-containing protein [Luteimonas panaciterrae]